MAKLISIIRTENSVLERRQLPLECDERLTLLVQFEDSCPGCHKEVVKCSDLQLFVNRFGMLDKDEIAVALMVSRQEVLNLVSQLIPCVGCRRSVEQMYSQLMTTGHPALEPIIVAPSGVLSVKREVLFDAKSMFALFYIHGSGIDKFLEQIPKSKKHKRCNVHSLESHTHKTRTINMWQEVWNVMSQPCKDEIVILDVESLMTTVDNYLRKHRFCTECKSKVLRAFALLRGEALDTNKDKSFQIAIYDGIRCCDNEGHIHVNTDNNFLKKLIARAEPELNGSDAHYSRRERHAKTLDIAQEEVLICVAIHLYDRLYKVYQKLRAEEQTWGLLFYLGVEALRKNFEVALENKQGMTNLERACMELLEEEKAANDKKELRKQKKKKKKNKQGEVIDDAVTSSVEYSSSFSLRQDKPCDDCEVQRSGITSYRKQLTDRTNNHTNGNCGQCSSPLASCRSDCGYSSASESCENCSSVSGSTASSDICVNDGDSAMCLTEETQCRCHSPAKERKKTKYFEAELCVGHPSQGRCGQGQTGPRQGHQGHRAGQPHSALCPYDSQPQSLEDMLLEMEGEENEVWCIPEEEVRRFKKNQDTVKLQREQLRQILKQKFASLEINPSELHLRPK